DGDGHTIEWQDSVWVLDPGDLIDIVDDDNNGYVNDLIGWDFVDVPFDWDPGDQPATGEDGQGEDNNPDDFNGHGSHTSGIAAAVTNNGIGVAAIGWNATIMPVRAGYQTRDGGGIIAWGNEGIYYAVENGADVISLSWGGLFYSQVAQDVINYAWERDVIIVAAAGNGPTSNRHYPAAYDHVYAVAATQSINDELAYWSNFGDWVDICAPGAAILSTTPNDTYSSYDGTSMCTPMVAGAAALLWAEYPTATNHEILLKLSAGADNIDNVGSNSTKIGQLGAGRLNVHQSLITTGTMPPNLALSAQFTDAAGDGDGIPEPGETVELVVTLVNRFLGGPDSNLTMTLLTDDYAVTVQSGQASFTDIQPLATVSNAGQPFIFSIAQTSIPHRATFTVEVVGDNSTSSFTIVRTLGRAAVLLVDDDDGANNVESYYFASLDSLGVPYDYWSWQEQGTPGSATLAQYGTVIWLTEWAFPALDSADRAEIGTYLSEGGRLFLSGQDIGWSLCEDSPIENEFSRSGGASLTWYRAFLKASYMEDDASPEQPVTQVTGVPGNPIGDDLVFTINQPGRDDFSQYPSVIVPLSGAEGIFRYPDYPNRGFGATMWTGHYSIVNFAFGYEAILDADVRLIVMDRVLHYLNDFAIEHEPLRDTENTENPYTVTVAVATTSATVDSMAVYWSPDGAIPFNIVPLIESQPGTGLYQGSIPAQSDGSTVHYFIFSATDDGFIQTSPTRAPAASHSFYVGLDTVAPEIATVTHLPKTLNNTGNYHIEAGINDNLGVDSTTVYLHFWVNSGIIDSLKMVLDQASGRYAARFSTAGSVDDGDTINYYITARDLSLAENGSTSPVFQTVIASYFLVDGFEGDLSAWRASPGWQTVGLSHSGGWSLKQSPMSVFYEPHKEYILELDRVVELSARSSAYISFWQTHSLGPGDTVFVETAGPNSDWVVARYFIGSNSPDWQESAVVLDITKEPSPRIRFRLSSDGSGEADGWYLDDVYLLADTTLDSTLLEREGPSDVLPFEYALLQNYPNPFNPVTTIQYHLPRPGEVRLRLYNLRGQLVRTLIDDFRAAGVHSVALNSDRLASGVYFYRLEAGDFTRTRKMVLLK
ncbi:MAG: S8 family peptidase, partial [Candidatus Marinimicrobia bacterium]|nr:S8 family peptidase [Candidatus Neomarinimicrobiota bacterium]